MFEIYQKRIIIVLLMLMVIFSSCTKGLHLKVSLEDLIVPEYPALIGEPVLAWTQKLSSTPKTVEYLAGSYILIITYPGEVFTMDFTSSEKKVRRWHPFRKRISNHVVDRNTGRLYLVSSMDDKLIAYNMLNKKHLWKRKIPHIDNHTALVGNTLMLLQTTGNIIALDNDSGELLESRKINRQLAGMMHHPSDTLLIITADGGVQAYTKKLEPIWKLPVNLNPNPVYTANNDRIILADSDGRIKVIDYHQGVLQFELDVHTPIYAPMLLSEERLFIATSAGEVLGIDLADGKVLWRYQGSGLINQPLLGNKSTLLVAYARGKLVLLNQDSGAEKWSYNFDHPLKRITLVPQGVVTVDSERQISYLQVLP